MNPEKAQYLVNKDFKDDKNLLMSIFDTPKIGDDFYEQLEWTLLFLSFKDSMYSMRENEKEFRLKTFDGAWLINSPKIGGGSEITSYSPLFEQVTPDMFPDMNLKLLVLADKETPESNTCLRQIKLIPFSERRHLKQYRNVIMVRTGFLTKNEKWYLTGDYYHLDHKTDDEILSQFKFYPSLISFDPKYFFPPEVVSRVNQSSPELKQAFLETVAQINHAFNLKFSAYYEWFIYIRETDNSIGFKIPINPSSSKEVFQLRDIPEGKVRKSAIVNFVKEHTRRIGNKDEMNQDEITTTIKRHLRGETKFNWRGLQVNVIPSEYDIKRIDSKTKKYLTV